ncbi:MAG: hypothetical protein HY360_14670 [Verrucomicrobia bacterium]|nr:hypothetical protein [Verrucomicrobiota bacterium]
MNKFKFAVLIAVLSAPLDVPAADANSSVERSGRLLSEMQQQQKQYVEKTAERRAYSVESAKALQSRAGAVQQAAEEFEKAADDQPLRKALAQRHYLDAQLAESEFRVELEGKSADLMMNSRAPLLKMRETAARWAASAVALSSEQRKSFQDVIRRQITNLKEQSRAATDPIAKRRLLAAQSILKNAGHRMASLDAAGLIAQIDAALQELDARVVQAYANRQSAEAEVIECQVTKTGLQFDAINELERRFGRPFVSGMDESAARLVVQKQQQSRDRILRSRPLMAQTSQDDDHEDEPTD